MTPSVDLYPSRRPIFFPVVIATVFLTIIGMTGGFMLGERHRRQVNSTGQARQSQTEPVATPSADVTSAGAATGGLCPEQTRQTAARLGFSTALRQVMKIETENGTTVWICQDDTGGYFYQGKTGGVDAALEEGSNGLFLSNVRHSEDREEYVAVATNGNQFTVNRKQLEIHFAKTGKTQITKVVVTE